MMNQRKRQYLGVLLLVIIVVIFMSPATVFAGNSGNSDDEGLTTVEKAGIGVIAFLIIGGILYGRRGDGTIVRIGDAKDPKIKDKIAKACKSNDDR